MTRNSLPVLLGLTLTILGSAAFHHWSTAPTGFAANDPSNPPPRAARVAAPTTRHLPGSTATQPDRSDPGHLAEPAAEFPLPDSPAPAAWEDAKARVERVQRRLQDQQRKALAAHNHQTRKPSPESRPSPAGNARDAEREADPAAALPPVIVPYNPQHPSLPATLPAVLADVPTGGGITPEQQAGVDQLAQDFLEAVADPLADPTDPDYQKRWQQAQMTADQLFRLRYGDYAWMLRHNAAYRQALGEKRSP